jgi:hypothetical protein
LLAAVAALLLVCLLFLATAKNPSTRRAHKPFRVTRRYHLVPRVQSL